MRAGEISKLVNFKDQLNPDLWENNHLRRDVELKLLQIAKAFIKFINIKDLKLTDISFSGSNASYNYNDHSDIDLHLVVDMSTPCGTELKELYQSKKSLFNDQHDISIKGHPVEVYVQDSRETHISNGIYSVAADRWIKQPKKITATPDTTNVEHKYDYLKNQIDSAIKSGDTNTIERIKEKIKQIRSAGLAKDGEFGVENLAFKLLRNDGSLEKLFQAKRSAEDEKLSLH